MAFFSLLMYSLGFQGNLGEISTWMVAICCFTLAGSSVNSMSLVTVTGAVNGWVPEVLGNREGVAAPNEVLKSSTSSCRCSPKHFLLLASRSALFSSFSTCFQLERFSRAFYNEDIIRAAPFPLDLVLETLGARCRGNENLQI